MKKLFVLLLGLVLLFSFCAVSAEDLNIAYMPNYASLWSVVTGVNMGYFEEEGLNVHLVEFADGPTIIAAMESGSIGLILPGMEKSSLFPGVLHGGVLPRKTFSMGTAREKRYYLEGKMRQ